MRGNYLEPQFYSPVLILFKKFTKNTTPEQYIYIYFLSQKHHKFEGKMYFGTDIKKCVEIQFLPLLNLPLGQTQVFVWVYLYFHPLHPRDSGCDTKHRGREPINFPCHWPLPPKFLVCETGVFSSASKQLMFQKYDRGSLHCVFHSIVKVSSYMFQRKLVQILNGKEGSAEKTT